MKSHHSIFIILSMSLTSITATASETVSKPLGNISFQNLQAVEKCTQRPQFLTQIQNQVPVNLNSLKNQVLVGKKAEFFVEAANSDGSLSQVYTSQIFKNEKSKSKVLCGQAKDAQKSFSIYAPTLIDNSLSKKVGHSFWQFQINAQSNQFSSWNRKTQALNESAHLEKVLSSIGADYKIFQINEKEIQILFSQEQDGVTQYLSIQYDII